MHYVIFYNKCLKNLIHEILNSHLRFYRDMENCIINNYKDRASFNIFTNPYIDRWKQPSFEKFLSFQFVVRPTSQKKNVLISQHYKIQKFMINFRLFFDLHPLVNVFTGYFIIVNQLFSLLQNINYLILVLSAIVIQNRIVKTMLNV